MDSAREIEPEGTIIEIKFANGNRKEAYSANGGGYYAMGGDPSVNPAQMVSELLRAARELAGIYGVDLETPVAHRHNVTKPNPPTGGPTG